MIHVLLGEDPALKLKKIEEIKSKAFKSEEEKKFDYEVLYGDKLDKDLFKQALIALPVVAKKKIVLLHNLHKLSAENQTILTNYIDSGADHCILILESDEPEKKNKFYKALFREAKVYNSGFRQKKNVFDMTNAMKARRPQDALLILSELVEDGSHPLQIMGGLVWFWGKNKNRLNAGAFKAGLVQLQEADLNIKRSRLPADYALEECVLKLCSLIA